MSRQRSARRSTCPKRPESQGVSITLYRTAGATVRRATLDGALVGVVPGSYLGHGTLTLVVNLRPGQTRTLDVQMDEPSATGPAIVPVQPLVRAQSTTISVPTCS